MKNALLHDGLEYWRRETPDKTAVVMDGDERLTYRELGDWTDGVAAKLADMGVVPGDAVAVCGANCLEWVAAGMGLLKAGATMIPFNDRFVRGEFADLMGRTTPKVVIADGPRAEIIASLEGAPAILSMDTLAQFKGGAPGWKAPEVSPDQVGLVVFTSGSSGRPKGVMFTHGGHMDAYHQLTMMDRHLGPNTRHLMTVGLHSGLGTMWGFPYDLSIGAAFYFLKKHDAALILKILVEEKITSLPTFPLVLDQLTREPGFEAADLSSITTAHAGGMRVPAALLAKWQAKGVMLRQMYGQTEVGGYGTIATDREVLEGMHSCGRGMIHTKLKVVRPDGSDCDPGEPGDVRVKGPANMHGYWGDPEATAKTLVDGWIHTGDLGVLDAEGYFSFVDRAKDMIISGGFNISPIEVEGVIGRAPGVLEVAVFAAPDEKFGETPVAVLYSASPVTPEAIFAHCRENLAGFKLPRYIVPLSEPLPRLSSGKINKRQLAADYADAPSRFAKLS